MVGTNKGVTFALASKKYKNNAAMLREDTLILMYRRLLQEMCSNRFKWSGLPDSINERFLEMTLFNDALCVFYFDSEFDKFLALRATGLGTVNMYDDPIGYRVFGNSMLTRELSADDCVPIWANQTRTPDHDIVEVYSERLAALDRTLEINMLGARHPFLLSVDTNERNTYIQAFNKVQEGQPVIVGTNQLSAQNIADKVQMFDMGYKTGWMKEIQEIKVKTWNECLTLLGIMNVNSEKRERMVVEEASGASGQVLAMRAVALNERMRAAERINKRFGLDVVVEWNLDETQSLQYGALSGVAGAMTEGNAALGSTDQEEMHRNG